MKPNEEIPMRTGPKDWAVVLLYAVIIVGGIIEWLWRHRWAVFIVGSAVVGDAYLIWTILHGDI